MQPAIVQQKVRRRLSGNSNSTEYSLGIRRIGQILNVSNGNASARLPNAALGQKVVIRTRSGMCISAEIIEVARQHCLLRLGALVPSQRITSKTRRANVVQSECITELRPGDLVFESQQNTLLVDAEICGSMRDGFGREVCRFAPPEHRLRGLPTLARPLTPPPSDPLTRRRPEEVFLTGVPSIDALCTIAHGQRMAIVAPPGVGKSTLVANIFEASDADVRVLVLIGERGREIRECLEDVGGRASASSTIVLASASDATAEERAQTVDTAMCYAEYFRHCGLSVVLVVDSLTRLARAWRDLAFARGELPIRQGYPASVFAALPRLLERPGRDVNGSITSFFTLLSSDEAIEDPLIEEVRSITDGHLSLSSILAQRGIFPALEIRSSISRLQHEVLSDEQTEIVQALRDCIASYEQDRDVVQLAGENSPSLQRLKEAYETIQKEFRSLPPYQSIDRLFAQLAILRNQLDCSAAIDKG